MLTYFAAKQWVVCPIQFDFYVIYIFFYHKINEQYIVCPIELDCCLGEISKIIFRQKTPASR